MATIRDYLIRNLIEDPSQKPQYEACVQAVLEGRASVTKGYPLYFRGTKLAPDYVFAYYLYELDRTGFDYEKACTFFEKMRKIITTPGEFYYYVLNPPRDWVNHHIRNQFLHSKKNQYGYKDWHLNEGVSKPPIPESHFKFAAYTAIAHTKYGASYMSVITNEILGMLKDLGSNLPAQLKKHGSGQLPKTLTEYKCDNLTCKANDAYATIKITMKEENEALYAKALDFLLNLIKADFPRSYSVDFRSPQKNYLPIKKMPKKGINQLFANAIQYPALHSKIESYARQAMGEDEWYNNLEAEQCAMPGTFAVFALGLHSETYHSLVVDYLKICDGEHQSLHGEFVLAYVEKYGFTEKGLELYKLCVQNIQHLPERLESLYKKLT